MNVLHSQLLSSPSSKLLIDAGSSNLCEYYVVSTLCCRSKLCKGKVCDSFDPPSLFPLPLVFLETGSHVTQVGLKHIV